MTGTSTKTGLHAWYDLATGFVEPTQLGLHEWMICRLAQISRDFEAFLCDAGGECSKCADAADHAGD